MIINQKAQEISLALIKISVYVRRQELRHRLEKLAFELLEEISGREFETAAKNIEVAQGLIHFGRTIYEIEPVNANILLQELGSLNSAIRQNADLSLPDTSKFLNIGEIFSGDQSLFDSAKIEKQLKKNPTKNPRKNAANEVQERNTAIAALPDEIAGSEDNPAIRQSAILERIRQFEGKPIQLKDIVAAFPRVSERTIRYDLQRLSASGLIERIGLGAGSSYKMRVL